MACQGPRDDTNHQFSSISWDVLVFLVPKTTQVSLVGKMHPKQSWAFFARKDIEKRSNCLGLIILTHTLVEKLTPSGSPATTHFLGLMMCWLLSPNEQL